jgi:FkbM family methyltransferase
LNISQLIRRIKKKLFLTHPIDIDIPREFHGSAYGGWTISPPVQGIVYSFGVGEDVSFEQSLGAKYDVPIFAFDPTPRSIEWAKTQNLPRQFRFLEYGVADYDGTARFYAPENPEHVSHSIIPNENTKAIDVPMKRLQTILAELGHTTIDVMKFDIEGAEYAVLDDMLRSTLRPRQLLVEFHHRFPQVGAYHTGRMVRKLRANGYQIFAISKTGEEYSFMKR